MMEDKGLFEHFVVVLPSKPPKRKIVIEYHPHYFDHDGGKAAVKGYDRRLQLLEKIQLSDTAIIERWISEGRYYDDLSKEEQAKYQKYRESLGGVADDIAGAWLEIVIYDTQPEKAYHFPLSRRKSPPTREEMKKRVQEVEEIVLGLTEEE